MNDPGYTIGMLRYAVTPGSANREDQAARTADLLRSAARWAADGVDFVQLREKDIAAGGLTALARRMVVALGPRTRLLINGRPDVAIAAGAAGVHLTARPDELTPAQVRHVFALRGKSEPTISVSCHTPGAALRARDGGADIVLFSPVFEKWVAGNEVVAGRGLEMLGQVCNAVAPLRVFALGGVTPGNAQHCVDAGAAGVAGIRLFNESL